MSYLELTDLSAAQAARAIAEFGQWEIAPALLDEVLSSRGASITVRGEGDERVVVESYIRQGENARRYSVWVERDDQDVGAEYMPDFRHVPQPERLFIMRAGLKFERLFSRAARCCVVDARSVDEQTMRELMRVGVDAFGSDKSLEHELRFRLHEMQRAYVPSERGKRQLLAAMLRRLEAGRARAAKEG